MATIITTWLRLGDDSGHGLKNRADWHLKTLYEQ